ncbi:MAG: response regulator, partial [Methylococcales bacterium]|nr:response regulator [Methylococcales bacterium]
RAFAAGLELNCALPVPMPPQWRGDPMRIRQVLTNLVGNAVKFTEQGEVSVNVTRTPLTDSLDELRFEVHDTGIGVSEVAQAQLFKPFSQADSATSRRFGGSGLGLSISKKLVELMGGSIGMRSVLGEGSCFWFTLPLAHSENNGDPGQNYDLSGKRVLVVDDNATNRNILINYLGRWGLDASEADSGKAALMALQTAAILGSGHDLVLLDMQMPGMDGLAVAQCLAKIPALAGIPVILLSSGDQFDLADYQDTGIMQRLLKPVRQAQLFDAVANALNGGQGGVARPARPGLELPDYRDKKVLVVEDNKINQKVIMAKLAQFCIQPGLAENGQEALDKLAAGRYDLILMDCQMPVLDGYAATRDGYAATRELRHLEAAQGWPRQTVVALTATASEGEREKCLAAGMDDYLSKPIIAEQLQAILASCLGVAASTTRPVLVDAISAPPATAQPVWDETATLAHLEGDRELMAELIGLFLQEGPMQLEALAKFLAADDLAALANTAHAIKGTTAHFYATEAKTAASELEQAARNGGPADFAALTEAVVIAVTALLGELRTAQNFSGQTC